MPTDHDIRTGMQDILAYFAAMKGKHPTPELEALAAKAESAARMLSSNSTKLLEKLGRLSDAKAAIDDYLKARSE